MAENHRIEEEEEEEEEEGGRHIHHSDDEEEDNDEMILAEVVVVAYSSSFHTNEVSVEEEATRSTPLQSDDDGTEAEGYCSTQQHRCSSSCPSRSLDNH
jgi:hypothetical protein